MTTPDQIQEPVKLSQNDRERYLAAAREILPKALFTGVKTAYDEEVRLLDMSLDQPHDQQDRPPIVL